MNPQFSGRQYYVRRPPEKRYDEKYDIETMKQSSSQMISGVTSKFGTAGSYFLKPELSTLNCQKYLELLQDELKIPSHIYGCITFMPDGSSCHKAKKMKEDQDQYIGMA